MRVSADGLQRVGIEVLAEPPRSHAPDYSTGYVLATYGPDVNGRVDGAVSCDVVLTDGERTVLYNVPVAVRGSSGPLRAAGAWRPNPTRRNLDSGSPLDPSLDPRLLPDLSALDGDHVRIVYEHGRSDRPCIVGGLPHPRAELRGADAYERWTSIDDPHPVSPNGDVVWICNGGTVVTIDRLGNAVINTTGAPRDGAGSDPRSSEEAGDPAGSIDLNLLDGAVLQLRFGGGAPALRITKNTTGVHLELLGDAQLDVGDAGQKAVKGDALLSYLQDLVTWAAGHTHPYSGGGGTTSAPAVGPSGPSEPTLLTGDVRLPDTA